MAQRPSPKAVACRASVLAVAASVLPLGLHGADLRITLEQLGSRRTLDYGAAYNGQSVAIRGVVSAPALRFADYTLLAIDDGSAGGMLKVPAGDPWLDRFHP